MKPWKVAAVSALVLMVLMTWPFVNAYLNPPEPKQAIAIGNDDVRLERVDGETMQLSEWIKFASAPGAWLTFMHVDCGRPCQDEIQTKADEEPLIIVVSPEGADDIERLSQWVGTQPNVLALTADERGLKKMLASYRVVVTQDNGGLDYPKRWAQLDQSGAFVQFHPTGLSD